MRTARRNRRSGQGDDGDSEGDSDDEEVAKAHMRFGLGDEMEEEAGRQLPGDEDTRQGPFFDAAVLKDDATSGFKSAIHVDPAQANQISKMIIFYLARVLAPEMAKLSLSNLAATFLMVSDHLIDLLDCFG